jgi:Uma2 family endonuclease
MTQKTRPDIADWLRSLGNVPLERIVMDPLPGTATESDLLTLVEGDRLVELIDGTLVEKPVGSLESRIALYLATAIVNFAKPRKLGVVTGADGTLRMKSGRVRLPDIAFFGIDDLPGGRPPNDPIPTLPPTLAVEVISEGNTTREMDQKRSEYFESGSRLVWMIYPKTRTVAVFEPSQSEPVRTLGEGDTLDGGTVLPGFSIPVTEIFEPLTRGF